MTCLNENSRNCIQLRLSKCSSMLLTYLVFSISRIVFSVPIKVGILIVENSYNDRILNQTFFDVKSNFVSLDKLELTTTITTSSHAMAIADINSMFTDSSIEIIIAESPNKYVSMLGLYATNYDKPLILPTSYLPYKQSHKTLSLNNGFKMTSSAVLEYLEWFRWANVSIISADDSYWRQMVPVLESSLFQQQFNVKHSRIISNVSSSRAVLNVLDDITVSEKAIILLMDPADAEQFLINASNWNSNHDHEFILVSRTSTFNFQDLVKTQNAQFLQDIYRYLFVIAPRSIEIDSTSVQNISQIEDAMIFLSKGLSLSYNSTMDKVDTNMFIPSLHSSTFTFKNRTFGFDQMSERMFDFSLYDFDENTHAFVLSRVVEHGINSSIWHRRHVRIITDVVPPDSCFKQVACDIMKGFDLVLILATSISVIVVAGIVTFLVIVIWRKRAKINLTKGPNKILLEMDDLTFLQKKGAKSAKMINGNFIDKPDLVKASEKSNRSLASLHELSEFSEYARYKGDVVYLKEIKVKGFEIKGKLLTYIRMLRDIRHENVNPMFGILIDPLRPAIVSEYSSRGSLLDVLKNNNIKLDWDFKVSLLTDLVRGLRFIQGTPIHCHGNLKSRNCVIDSRWVLKLTDFGMPGFRERAKMTANYDSSELLWTAPEHLRDPFPGMKGTEKGDMYSLAIIMQEVILRKDPFGMVDLKPKEIIQKLRNPPPLLRPSVSPQAAQPQYIQLMKECWSENPELRPAIEDVYQQFKHIAGGKKMNIVDSMFRMLEKYSNDLEDIVKERTVQLEEEKIKTDMLLYRMLPATVAESLKLGKAVEAVSYSEVTIYFSDIVGFTTISAMSTPMQVVDLLNDLYTMFDATIDNYDVYKVETIGDAYMVVSGLPLPNTCNAGEIGTMALDLLSQCGTFTIRHMPEVPLRLRIGLHTGSCVAGVVGLTMPRYCLFGDTVNTASRMESSGAAFRIHISNDTKQKLDELGGYITDYRGKTELKGKGLADTHWLTGKKGFNKPLPDPPVLTDGANHGLDTVFALRKESDSSSSTTKCKGQSIDEQTKIQEEIPANNEIRKVSKTSNAKDIKSNKQITVNKPMQDISPKHIEAYSLNGIQKESPYRENTKMKKISMQSMQTVDSVVSSSDISIISKSEDSIAETSLCPVSEV